MASALIVDAVALAAIAARISEFGFTPNRVAALGENLILLANLAGSAWLYARFLRRHGSYRALERWQIAYLPVYSVSAAGVVIAFPIIFGARQRHAAVRYSTMLHKWRMMPVRACHGTTPSLSSHTYALTRPDRLGGDMALNGTQEQLCADNSVDYTDLRAVLVNTSLKKRATDSHTRLLLDVVGEIMTKGGVSAEHVHLLDYQVPPGVYPDMTEHGWPRDDWPVLWERIRMAHILVIGTPLWLGEESSACRVLIERLYGMSGMLNPRGQSIYYNKVGGCVVTGNEDGIKHAAMTIGYALSHLGFTIPPQADCGWIGEAGPGPSFGDTLDDGRRAGFDNDFTQRNTTIMTWNLMHLARILVDVGGISNHGNNRELWKAGCRFGYENPEHRA